MADPALPSDFKIYEAHFQEGMTEGVAQALIGWGAASNNALVLASESHPGNYRKEGFFQMPSGLVTRRDITSVSAATVVAPSQEELVEVKCHRKIGPFEYTEVAIRMLGKSLDEASFNFGIQIGQAKAQAMLNDALTAVGAALEGQSGILYDATGLSTKTLVTEYLNNGIAKMGDQGSRIVAWVMHSKPFYNLIGSQITDKITNVADVVIFGGAPGTLNRPVIVTDSPALVNDITTDTYNVLGLVAGGVTATESEQGEVLNERVGGGENIKRRIQGEYAVTLGCHGFGWNVSGGGANPTDAALATTSNWTLKATSLKDAAGVRILVQ